MPRDLNSDVTLKDCLFGGVKLDRNTDPDKCVYIWLWYWIRIAFRVFIT